MPPPQTSSPVFPPFPDPALNTTHAPFTVQVTAGGMDAMHLPTHLSDNSQYSSLERTSDLPVSEDDRGTCCLRPTGGACKRVCFLGSTGRGGVKACRRNRLFGPSTSTYFTDGRIDEAVCGTRDGDEGLSTSGSCNSVSAGISTPYWTDSLRRPCGDKCRAAQSSKESEICSRTSTAIAAAGLRYIM